MVLTNQMPLFHARHVWPRQWQSRLSHNPDLARLEVPGPNAQSK